MPKRTKITQEARDRVRAIMTGGDPPDSALELTRRYNEMATQQGFPTINRITISKIRDQVALDLTKRKAKRAKGGRLAAIKDPEVVARVRAIMQRKRPPRSNSALEQVYNAEAVAGQYKTLTREPLGKVRKLVALELTGKPPPKPKHGAPALFKNRAIIRRIQNILKERPEITSMAGITREYAVRAEQGKFKPIDRMTVTKIINNLKPKQPKP